MSRIVIKCNGHSGNEQQRDSVKVKTPIFAFKRSLKPGRSVLSQMAKRYLILTHFW